MMTALSGLTVSQAAENKIDEEGFKSVGSFTCKGSADITPMVSPGLQFTLKLQGEILTKEYTLSGRENMSKAKSLNGLYDKK